MPDDQEPIMHRFKDAGFTFYCPACREHHAIWVDKPNPRTGCKWTWNGSMDKPTFTPSVALDGPRCHFVITDGVINYQGDCGHKLAGQSIPMEPWQ